MFYELNKVISHQKDEFILDVLMKAFAQATAYLGQLC